MKITQIHTMIARLPLGQQRFLSSQCVFPGRNSLLVRVDTDEGISGWGEGGQYGPPEPVASCIVHVLAPRILGRSPLDHGRIGQELYAATRDFGQKGSYVEATAVHMSRGLERYGVHWFEEPVPPEDREGYRRVRSSTSVPIAGGECEYTRYGFRDLIAGGCVDIAQPDLCVAGGFSEWLKIVALAESFGVWHEHWVGLVGGFVWGTGTVLTFVAAGFVGMALAGAIGQANSLAAAIWGVFVWREFAGVSRRSKLLLTLMFVFYVSGIVSIAFSHEEPGNARQNHYYRSADGGGHVPRRPAVRAQ